MTVTTAAADRSGPLTPIEDRNTEREDKISREALFAAGVAVLYFITIGGSSAGEVYALLRAVNAVLGAVVVYLWVTRMARDHDRVDEAVLVGLLVFLAACLASTRLRMSFDSAVAAMAWAATFWYARRVLAFDRARQCLIWIFGGLFIGLLAFYFLLWTGYWLEWAALLGELPPLSLPLPTGLYLHRHDVALLLVMLAPALLMPVGFGRLRPLVWVCAVALGVVLLIDGSRSLAAAVTIALVAIYLPRLSAITRRGWRRVYWALVAVSAAGVVLAALSGLAGPALARLFDVGTLSARGALWGTGLDLFAQHPIFGVGPGTYQFNLSGTGYYDTSAFLPRHTDGAPIMLLTELGLVGLFAIAIPASVILPRLTRVARQHPSVAFPPAVFVLAGLGSVPSDFAYLVLPFLLWTAYALPRPTNCQVSTRPRFGLAKAALGASTAVAVALTVVATWSYESGLRSARGGDIDSARTAVTTAAALDPTFALYQRVAAAIALADGDARSAVAWSEGAIQSEPSDVAAYRVASLANLSAGQATDANLAAEEAVRLVRSDPLNHQLALLVAAATKSENAAEFAVSLIERAPWHVIAVDWADLGLEPRNILMSARHRLDSDHGALGPIELQWLRALTNSGDDRLVTQNVSSVPAAFTALSELFDCDMRAAQTALSAANTWERGDVTYWRTVAMVAAAAGNDTESALTLAKLAGHQAAADTGEVHLSFRTDLLGYRRVPPSGLPQPVPFTSTAASLETWLLHPIQSAASATPWAPLGSCGAPEDGPAADASRRPWDRPPLTDIDGRSKGRQPRNL